MMKFSWLRRWQRPTQIHGTLFDLGVFLGSWGLLALNPAALAALFVVFYLPSRYLFLVEDYLHPTTWLRLWLVLLPIFIAIFQK